MAVALRALALGRALGFVCGVCLGWRRSVLLCGEFVSEHMRAVVGLVVGFVPQIRVQGSGFRVQGSRFRVKGLVLRAEG